MADKKQTAGFLQGITPEQLDLPKLANFLADGKAKWHKQIFDIILSRPDLFTPQFGLTRHEHRETVWKQV